MKPFDLTKAQAGDPILLVLACGYDTTPVRLVGMLTDGRHVVERRADSGVYYVEVATEHRLRMAPKKRTIFLNIYQVRLNDRKAFEACAFDEHADAIHDSAVNGAKFHTIATPVEIEE